MTEWLKLEKLMHAANELVTVFITICTICKPLTVLYMCYVLIYSVLHSIKPYFYFLLNETDLQSNNTLAAADNK